jgi:hypothetical protein
MASVTLSLGTAVSFAFLVTAAPSGVAVADPDYGPDLNDPLITNYMDTVNALMSQYAVEGESGQMSAQELRAGLLAANDQFRDALFASMPKP